MTGRQFVRESVRWFVCTLALVISPWSTASAHPIHTTMSTITMENGVVTLRIRAFADDLSASVAAFAGKSAPSDSSMAAADVDRYAKHAIRVTDANGRGLTVSSCGVTRAREVYWVCLKVDGAKALTGLQMSNAMLVDRHADQVNIVLVKAGTVRRTLLFTKGADAKTILS